ncbi:hypothetical protein M0R45_019296 [Rubus argutus]|uniref:Uncharacterized protein n=1 Tax=Rubus argutus TaxID=59490 RepID=A0AAW1X5E9_RUBAR
MEALHLSKPHSAVLQPKRLKSFSQETQKVSTCHPTNPLFITATLSQPTAKITVEPSSSNSLPHLLTLSPPPNRVSSSSLQYEPGFLGAVPDRTIANRNCDKVIALGSLTNILTSKLYDVAIESSLELAPKFVRAVRSQRLAQEGRFAAGKFV